MADQNNLHAPAAASGSARKTYRIPEGSLWGGAYKATAVLFVIGAVIAVAGWKMQPERFGFSYLYGFITVLTLWLGSVFFTLIQHLTSAGWSVSVRRASEFYISGFVVLPVLFLPLLLNLGTLYPWWGGHEEHHEAASMPSMTGLVANVAHAQEHGEAAPGPSDARAEVPAGEGERHEDQGPVISASLRGTGEHVEAPYEKLEEANMSKKGGYLNPTFFFIRLIAYFLVWTWLGLRLFGYSTAQDATGDKSWTVKLQRFAPGATFAFAISLTFAAFDWIMSLQPGWYSTMFGVRIFASSAVTSFALVIVTTLGWKRAGLVGNEINTEHFHDLGKLMFGFLIFWAYVSFSEFFLIWYAAIPEETAYYHLRWDQPSWRYVSCAIVGLKFIVPFYFTMSRNAKRNDTMIGVGAAWLLGMHLVEMYYWIMPNYAQQQGVQLTGIWMELGCVMMTLGAYLTVVFYRMRQHSLIAVGDPRLPRAINFVNA